jgi:Fe-Mn family superoxide dismutase
MAIQHPDPPYDYSALAPHVSAETMQFHDGEHHRAYVEKTNELIAGGELDDLPLVEIIRRAAGDQASATLFNNAAQAWNHAFYWSSMSPEGGGEPSGALRERIERQFGSVDDFRQQFAEAALAQFGSGWAWLVRAGDRLEIRTTPNAATPIAEDGVAPLLTMDVWEHAYYIDYRNDRGAYVKRFLDNLANWRFANANLRAAETRPE